MSLKWSLFRSRYDPELARFQDPPPDEPRVEDDHTPFSCQSCLRSSQREREKLATPGSPQAGKESDTSRTYYRYIPLSPLSLSLSPLSLSLPSLSPSPLFSLYSSFSYKGVRFAVGESVYVPASTHRFSVKPHNSQKPKKIPSVS